MQSFEKLAWIAESQCEVAELARQMIGVEELAIMLAKDALSETSLRLSPTKVARAINMSGKGAKDKIDGVGFKAPIHRSTVQYKIDNLAVRNGS